MTKYKYIIQPIEGIDKTILPYIIKINKMGHRTQASCSGTYEDHKDDKWFTETPGIATTYVVFYTGANKEEDTDELVDEYTKCIERAGRQSGFRTEGNPWGDPTLSLRLHDENKRYTTPSDLEKHFNLLITELKTCENKITPGVRKKIFPFI